MRAVIHTRYGPPEVLRIEEVERPTPRDDELLVRVHATTVNRTDCGFRKPEPVIVRLFSGLLRPRRRILGSELAGEVAGIGGAVSEFAVGDRVFGVNANRFGAHAEYVCVAQRAPIATMPSNMSFERAAVVCDGAILALTYLRRAAIGAGRKILIYGASGSIGTATVQLARQFGAQVTASATRRTSTPSDRSAPTRSSTTPATTSPPTRRPTTSSSTRSASSRSRAARVRSSMTAST